LAATTPLFIDHAAMTNADLPLAVAWLLGCLSLALWVEDGERHWLVAAALALAGGAWLKVDGAYLGPAFLGLALLLRLLSVRRQATALRPVFLQGLFALGWLLLLTAPWYLYAGFLDLRPSTPGTALAERQGWQNLTHGASVIGAELLLSGNNSAWGLMGGGFGALWLLVAGALVCGWRRVWRDTTLLFLIIAVIGGISCYLAIYVLRPYSSVERYLLHLAPIAVIAAQRATGGEAVR
jgi:hypothetical protein